MPASFAVEQPHNDPALQFKRDSDRRKRDGCRKSERGLQFEELFLGAID
jgi:hypothetical protein